MVNLNVNEFEWWMSKDWVIWKGLKDTVCLSIALHCGLEKINEKCFIIQQMGVVTYFFSMTLKGVGLSIAVGLRKQLQKCFIIRQFDVCNNLFFSMILGGTFNCVEMFLIMGRWCSLLSVSFTKLSSKFQKVFNYSRILFDIIDMLVGSTGSSQFPQYLLN